MNNEKAHWKKVTVEQIAAHTKYALAMGPFGSRITKDNFIEAGVPVIRGINLSNGRFNHNDLVFLSENKADELAASNAFADDLIFTHRGTLGQVGIVPKGYFPRYVVSQSQMKLTCDQTKAIPMFLYYYFCSSAGQHEILSHVGGSGVPAISSPLTTLRNAVVYLPPLPIQRVIASILSAYDDLIENNTRHIAILEEIARLLYEEWFVKFRFPGHEEVRMVASELGMIPEGWEIKPFSDLVKIMSGGTPRTSHSDYWNGTIPFFTPKDAPEAFYVLDTEKHITEEGLHACNSQLYPANTIFITARGTVGKVLLSSREMAMNQSCYALQGREGISQFFLLLHLSHSMEYFKKVANGAVFSTIIVDTFKAIQVVKPPIHLIDRFHTETEALFRLTLDLLKKNDYLRRTRDKLLPRLISGEIDVSSWVEDEEEEMVRDAEVREAREPAMVRERGPVASIDAHGVERPSLWEEA